MRKYMEKGGIDKGEMEYGDCFKWFIFGEKVYEIKTKYNF